MSLIQATRFDSGKIGVNLLILGAVHGNEVCGPVTLQKFIEKFENGTISPLSGSVTFVPVANPRAFEAGKRQIDENLNRVFGYHHDPQTYEKNLANDLTPLIDNADVIVDIHSTLRPSEPFTLVATKNFGTDELTRIMGASTSIIVDRAAAADPNRPATTSTTYAASVKKPGITVECGQHEDDTTFSVAETAVWNALDYYKVAKGVQKPIGNKTRETLEALKIYYNDQVQGYIDDKLPSHMQRFNKGEEIAILNTGEIVKAPADKTAVLFPNRGTSQGQAPGAEQFYIAVPSSF